MTETTQVPDVSGTVGVDVSTQGAVAWKRALASVRRRAESLYPESVGQGVSLKAVAAGSLFVVVAAGLSLKRVGGPGALQSMWAEDGAVFYQATFHQGLLSALVTPNNGYAEFLPRFLMGLISFLPVVRAATAIALTGALISSGLALLVYHASAEHIRSRLPRAGLAAVTALLVYGAGEVADNIVNLQWYLLYVTFWMFLWNPQAVGRRALAAVVLFVAVASDPVSTFFLLPLLAVRLWCRPWKQNRWQVYGLVAGLVFQAIAILHGGGGTRNLTTNFSLNNARRTYERDILSNALVSRPELTHLGFTAPHLARDIGIVLVLAAIVGAVLLRSTRGLFAAVCLFSSFAVFTLSVMASGYSLPRYDTTPILLLITAFAVLVDGPGLCRRLAVALCVMLAVNLYANFPIGTDQYRAQSPSWAKQVERGERTCKQDPAIGMVTVVTAPGGPWMVQVPCSALR